MKDRQQKLTSQGLCGVCGWRKLFTALRCKVCQDNRLEAARDRRNTVSEMVPLTRIKIDGGTQTRASIRAEVVDEYAAPLEEKDFDLPEAVVFEDCKHLWMADGFHRFLAYEKAGRKKMPVKIRNGTVKDALLYSAGCNSTHGVRRSNEDKREAVRMLLADADWAKASDHWIAEKCKVSHPLVASVRAEMNTGQKGEESNATGNSSSRDNQGSEKGEKNGTGHRTGKDGRSYKPRKSKASANGTAETNGTGEETKPVITDDWGIPIQPHAKEAFKAREKFDELLSLLRKADLLYSDIAEMPGGAYLIRPGISINARDRWKHKGIKTALMNITDCRPTYTVCPRTFHAKAFPESNFVHDEDCPLCHGLNWSRPLRKEEVQEEVIAAVKGAFGCSS